MSKQDIVVPFLHFYYFIKIHNIINITTFYAHRALI